MGKKKLKKKIKKLNDSSYILSKQKQCLATNMSFLDRLKNITYNEGYSGAKYFHIITWNEFCVEYCSIHNVVYPLHYIYEGVLNCISASGSFITRIDVVLIKDGKEVPLFLI